MGIYSRPVKLGDKLNDGDRVEIYRPLIADPKELRRQRAEQAKSKAQSAPYFCCHSGQPLKEKRGLSCG